MKSRKLLFIVVILLLCSNFVTILFVINKEIKYRNKITVMNHSTSLLEDELGNIRVKNFDYQSENKVLTTRNEEIIKENELLKTDNEQLKEELETLTANKLLSDQVIRKYEVMQKSSSITLKEKDTFIRELNDKISQFGEIDVFELPVRHKEYDAVKIWLEDGAHESYGDMAMTYINKLPQAFVDELIEQDWKFIITTRNIEETYKSKTKNTIGLTIYSKKRIYVLNNEAYIASAIIHEFAHALDSLNGYVSFGEDWMAIYNEEKTLSGFSEYFKSDPREFFAECVQQYYTYKEVVRKNMPKSYEFIKTLMKQYEE